MSEPCEVCGKPMTGEFHPTDEPCEKVDESLDIPYPRGHNWAGLTPREINTAYSKIKIIPSEEPIKGFTPSPFRSIVYPISCKEGMREMCYDLIKIKDDRFSFSYDKWNNTLLIVVQRDSSDSQQANASLGKSPMYVGEPAEKPLVQDKSTEAADFSNFSRLTVVDQTGRAYEQYDVKLEHSIQDNGKTLKIFVSPHSSIGSEHKTSNPEVGGSSPSVDVLKDQITELRISEIMGIPIEEVIDILRIHLEDKCSCGHSNLQWHQNGYCNKPISQDGNFPASVCPCMRFCK